MFQENEFSNLFSNINFFDMISFLDIDERTILSMYYSDEYKTKEISEILNMNESTIRSKISRAKYKIKERYNMKG